MNSNPRSEKEWQAERDAHTLAEAKVIATDNARLNAAAGAASRMAEEQKERAAAMQKVADNPRAASNPPPSKSEPYRGAWPGMTNQAR